MRWILPPQAREICVDPRGKSQDTENETLGLSPELIQTLPNSAAGHSRGLDFCGPRTAHDMSSIQTSSNNIWRKRAITCGEEGDAVTGFFFVALVVASAYPGCTLEECALPDDGFEDLWVQNPSIVGTAVGPPPGGSNPTTTSISFFVPRPACCIRILVVAFLVQAEQSDENYELSLETPFGLVPPADVYLVRPPFPLNGSNPATFLYEAQYVSLNFDGRPAATVVAHFTTSVAGNITDRGAPNSILIPPVLTPRLSVRVVACPDTTTSTTSTTTSISKPIERPRVPSPPFFFAQFVLHGPRRFRKLAGPLRFQGSKVCAGTKLVEIPGGDIQVGPGPNGFQLASVVDARGTEREETRIRFEIDIPCCATGDIIVRAVIQGDSSRGEDESLQFIVESEDLFLEYPGDIAVTPINASGGVFQYWTMKGFGDGLKLLSLQRFSPFPEADLAGYSLASKTFDLIIDTAESGTYLQGSVEFGLKECGPSSTTSVMPSEP
eukprot:s620_g17.t2